MPKAVTSKKPERLAVGEAIRFHRRRAGITQRQLATVIHARAESISRIERGQHQPSLRRLAAIATALGVAPEVLLARGGESISNELLALLRQVQRLDLPGQLFVLETLQHQLAFLTRASRLR